MESSSDIKLPGERASTSPLVKLQPLSYADENNEDMNVPSNLEFYRQIIDFENDTGRHELILGNLDRSQQRAVQSLAHSRNFDYEYQQGYARVLRGSTTNWNIEAMVENSPTEIAHYDEPIDSGRLLDDEGGGRFSKKPKGTCSGGASKLEYSLRRETKSFYDPRGNHSRFKTSGSL